MPTVWDLGLYIFLTHIIRSPKYPISSLLISGIITLITSDRLGDTINSSVIRSATEMLTDLSNHSPEIIKRIDDQNGGNGGGEVGQSIYKTDFEPVFLLHSREFYREEGNRLLSNDNAAQYLLKVICLSHLHINLSVFFLKLTLLSSSTQNTHFFNQGRKAAD
jgi:cullin 3